MKRTIAIGDPSAKRASFTRFVLPFAWQAEKVEKSTPQPSRFRRATAKDWIHSAIENEQVVDQDRCRYFTPETAELLYHRASWFVLEENEPSAAAPFEVKSGLKAAQHTYQVALRPPALILFEDSPSAGRYGQDATGDLLRSGFLVIEAFFPDEKKPPSFEDMLRFNEIFRFWRCPFEKHATDCAAELNSIYKGIFGTEIPKDREKNYQSLYTDRWAKLFRHPIMDPPGQSFFVVPQKWLTEEASSFREDRHRNGDPLWLVQPDERAFTVACAFLNGDVEVITNLDKKKTRTWAGAVASGFEDKDTTFPIPGLSGHWVKILNIDRPYEPDDDGSCSLFEYRWAMERTYRRWAGSGSLYGFTPHSMALLAGGKDEACEDPHGEPPLALHCGGLYFDATLLLFYVRASLFRFSKRLHDLSARFRDKQLPEDSPEWKDWAVQVATIRWQFLHFENLYQFPLLSNQQQHLEMYELQRRCMDIQEIYQEIDKEVQSSDHVLNAKLDKQRNELGERRNQLATRLNWVAAVGLGLSVALTCYQITGFKEWIESCFNNKVARSDTQPLNIWVPIIWCAIWVVLFLLLPLAISMIYRAKARCLPSSFTSKNK